MSRPSLTIDILNKSSLPGATAMCFGGSLPPILKPMDEERLRGDFRERQAVWGIKETSILNNRQSNGVALTGERVIIYIAPRGHSAGYLSVSSDPVFARSTLTVTVYDILRGTQSSLDFSGFETPADDPSRYLYLRIPEYDGISAAFAASQGEHGLYVIRISESYSFYSRSDFTAPLPMTLPIVNESWSQIQSIYWKGALNALSISPFTNIGILSACDFRKYNLPISTSVTPASEVFDHNASFVDFRRSVVINGTPTFLEPSTEQKETMVRDGSMALISTQLPILPSDAAVSPVIGIGIAAAATPPATTESTTARPDAWTGATTPEASRLFGLTGEPPAINTIETLNSITNNHSQLGLTLRDPLRVFECDQIGNSGTVAFSVGAESTGISTVSKAGTQVLSITIGDNFPVISDVRISPIGNLPVPSGAELSFKVCGGKERIAAVSYGFSVDDEAYFTSTDNSGTSRRLSVDWGTIDKMVGVNSILYGCVGVESTSGEIRFFRAFYSLSNASNRPAVTALQASQRRDGSGKIQLSYDYLSSREIEPASAAVLVNSANPSASRDVGWGVLPGPRVLSWTQTGSSPALTNLAVTSASSVVASGDSLRTPTFSLAASAPYVTLATEGSRYGVGDDEDPKDMDLEFEDVQTIQSISSSLDSSTSLSSGQTSMSSRSSGSFSSSRGHSSSSSSTFVVCRRCSWSLKCLIPDARMGERYYGGRVCVVPNCTTHGQQWLFSHTTLPAGLSMNPLNGDLFGTPLVYGTFTFTTTVSETRCGDVQHITCTINIDPSLYVRYTPCYDSSSSSSSNSSTWCLHCTGWSLASCPAGSPTVGHFYSGSVSITGIDSGCELLVAPVFSIISGSLPPGLTINPRTGIISGTPTQNGNYAFTVQAMNIHCNLAKTIVCSFSVSGAIALSSSVRTPTCSQSSIDVPSVEAFGGLAYDSKLRVISTLTVDDWAEIVISAVGGGGPYTSYSIQQTSYNFVSCETPRIIRDSNPAAGSILRIGGTGAEIVIPAGSRFHFVIHDTCGVERQLVGTLEIIPA